MVQKFKGSKPVYSSRLRSGLRRKFDEIECLSKAFDIVEFFGVEKPFRHGDIFGPASSNLGNVISHQFFYSVSYSICNLLYFISITIYVFNNLTHLLTRYS
jgi:hypothetical protein